MTTPAAIKEAGLNKLAVFGHSGFIGTRLCDIMRTQLSGLPIEGFSYPEYDLTQAEDLGRIGEALDAGTGVVILAGHKKQWGDDLAHFDKNMKLGQGLAGLLEAHPVRRVIFFSTADVYGEDINNTAITEDTPVCPRSYYGMAKFTTECLLQKGIAAQPETSLVVLRPPLVYGPHDQGSMYGPSGFSRAVLSEEAITLWGDGSELREFLYVDDVADLVMRLLAGRQEGVLNPVSGRSHSFRDLLDCLARLTGKELDLAHRERSRDKVDNGFINTRIQAWFPDFMPTPLEEGLRRTVAAVQRGEVA